MYDQVITTLRNYYDKEANERNQRNYDLWKQEEREHFLTLLKQENKVTLLEIGAGPGRDGVFFQQHGLEVVCTDLSPEMVKLCQQKGLTAYVMDFLHLDFPPQSFDAVHALNCLLHVPTQDLPAVLQAIQTLLKPGGLFYLGVYGGIEHEETGSDDPDAPKRFFYFHTDDYMQRITRQFFEVLSFKTILTEGGTDLHFQALILRRS